MANDIGRVGVLWRGDRDASKWAAAEQNRLGPLFSALADLDVAVEPVVYSDESADDVRGQLLALDGVLVWVDPIAGGHDRSQLDPLLRDVAARGTWVSAHPDVILKMGTKEVLVRTRDVGWGTDTHRYGTLAELKREFPARLLSSGPRVLKQNRGNGGIGVWKVELASAAIPTPGATAAGEAVVRVQHAQTRDNVTEELPLAAFLDRCAGYFSGDGILVDQPFQPRIAQGMVRCYMVRDEIVGFAHQSPDELTEGSGEILGLPSAKTMFPASEPRFRTLRTNMESEWVPGMQRVLGIDAPSLPMLWDADFLYGPLDAAGQDTYVLCEINVSCVFPFPQEVVPKLAQAVATRLRSAARPRSETPR